MKIIVNKKDKIVPSDCSVELLAQIMNIKEDASVAIAVGMEVIEKNVWKETKLKEGDKVTIISAVCGG